MCLGLAVGRGGTPLARLGGEAPLVDDAESRFGRRDAAEPWYGHAALAASQILDLPDATLLSRAVSPGPRRMRSHG